MTNGRHSLARRGFFSTLSVRSMLLTAAMVVLTLCIVIISSGGTFARLSSQASVPAATISSGTATLTVSTLALPTTLLYPGLTVAAPATVTNTGNVPLVLSVSALTPPSMSTALSAALTVGVTVVVPPASCGASATPDWTKTFAGAVEGGISPLVPTGATATLCVQVALPLSAPSESQEQTASNFALTITGIQN